MKNKEIRRALERACTEIVVAWIIENVDASVVPADEGNDIALIYNLVHLAIDGKGFRHYNYEPEQDDEIDDLRAVVLK